ncbi:hypothetical protein L7F22_016684 [Adiantum nelumboides]|nr:hypothetical protein [Adiantum nelumboides]
MRQLCQPRCVCKAWNAVLAWGGSVAPGRLLAQHQSVYAGAEDEYWFVMCMIGSVFAASSTHEEKLKFQLPLIDNKRLSHLASMHQPFLAASLDARNFGRLIANAGGLLCAVVKKVTTHPSSLVQHRKGQLFQVKNKFYPAQYGEFDVLVFNCLTGSVKVLPQLLHANLLFANSSTRTLYMAVDEQDPCRYYVLLSDSCSEW